MFLLSDYLTTETMNKVYLIDKLDYINKNKNQ